jgi:hypothetical protein
MRATEAEALQPSNGGILLAVENGSSGVQQCMHSRLRHIIHFNDLIRLVALRSQCPVPGQFGPVGKSRVATIVRLVADGLCGVVEEEHLREHGCSRPGERPPDSNIARGATRSRPQLAYPNPRLVHLST